MAAFRAAHGYKIWRVRDFWCAGYDIDEKAALQRCYELTYQTGDTHIVVPWKRIDRRTLSRHRKPARKG